MRRPAARAGDGTADEAEWDLAETPGRRPLAARAWRNGASLGLRTALRVGRGALDLVLPPHCPSCDAEVETPGRLCADCFREASFIAPPCCRHCGAGFDSVEKAGLTDTCQDCLLEPPPWRSARAALRYDGFSRRLILPLKYSDRTENARMLAVFMARAGRDLLNGADLLIPVPLHRSRLFSRRYNQAGLLAQEVARLSGVPVLVDGLARRRRTATLVGQGAAARRRTMEDAIAVRPHRQAAIAGRHVVLIDDVLTTGATVGACALVLQQAGAASVDVLAAARTGREAE